jgi:hypothetical protein
MKKQIYKSKEYLAYSQNNGNTKCIIPGEEIVILEEGLEDSVKVAHLLNKDVFFIREEELKNKFELVDSFPYTNINFTTVIA